MANDSKKISELTIATTLSANDRVVVLTNPATSAQTQTITLQNITSSIGYANATSAGVIKVGSGLAIDGSGVLSAPIPVANTTSYGVVKVGNNLSVNSTGYLNAPAGGAVTDFTNVATSVIPTSNNTLNLGSANKQWNTLYTTAVNSDDQIYLVAPVNQSANVPYGEVYIGSEESGVYNQQDSSGTWGWFGTNIVDREEPIVFIENTKLASNTVTRWIFDLHGKINLPANGDITSNGNFTITEATTISANTIVVHNNVFDDLNRPLINVNALDINADGGTPTTVFGPSDTVFDGGAVTTVFGQYEAALDGGVSFNNRHSASFIDGGGANHF